MALRERHAKATESEIIISGMESDGRAFAPTTRKREVATKEPMPRNEGKIERAVTWPSKMAHVEHVSSLTLLVAGGVSGRPTGSSPDEPCWACMHSLRIVG